MKYTVYPRFEALRLKRLEAQIEAANIRRLQRRMEVTLNIITTLLWALMLAAAWHCFGPA